MSKDKKYKVCNLLLISFFNASQRKDTVLTINLKDKLTSLELSNYKKYDSVRVAATKLGLNCAKICNFELQTSG